MRSPPLITALWCSAGALTLVGLAVTVIAVNTPLTGAFGWFAYQPLADEVFMPMGGIVLTPTAVLGIAVTVSGLLALSFLLGRHVATKPKTSD